MSRAALKPVAHWRYRRRIPTLPNTYEYVGLKTPIKSCTQAFLIRPNAHRNPNKRRAGFSNPPSCLFVSTQPHLDHRERQRSSSDFSFSYWETHIHQIEEPISTPATVKAFQVSPVEPVAYLLS